jgi:hypothetical protein
MEADPARWHYGVWVGQQLVWPPSGRRRHVVMVIKKEPNQLYGVVETMEGLDITRERARKYRGIFLIRCEQDVRRLLV